MQGAPLLKRTYIVKTLNIEDIVNTSIKRNSIQLIEKSIKVKKDNLILYKFILIISG